MDRDFEERPLADTPLVVLDTETTGLYPTLGHRVVEIGAVRIENDVVVGALDQLVHPGRSIDPAASRVNGIVDGDLVDAPPFTAVVDDLLALADGALVVAHNARFDADFVGLELFLSATTPRPAPRLASPWLCTLLLARNHFYFGRNNLGHIARRLGVRAGHAHRALNDVYMTAAILKRMRRERSRLVTVGDWLHAQGGAIYATPPDAGPMPEPIGEAIAAARQLDILYLAPNGETRRRITPRYPTRHRGAVYLVAYCHLRQDQRTFRLDRIFSATLVDDAP